MEYKVAQIIPYFGKWPEWIELYFYSCGKNPMVDFIFYTDCPPPKHHYKNTIFNQCTYNDYCNLISQRLNIDYHCEKPYKLTDLKPFIGFIHKQELKGYDFWGMGDLDLVYGNLGMVINDTILNKYDVITTHNYHIAGHCCFCRNNVYYRNLCFKIKNWKQKITNEKAMSIDEGEWSDLVCPYIRTIRRIHKYIFRPFNIHYFKILDILNPILHPKVHLHEYWTSPQPKINEEWTYMCKENHIIDSYHRELPYLHFLFFKKTPWLKTNLYWEKSFWTLDKPIENYSNIFINAKGILSNENRKE
mgnify:CR=1 FL=1